MTIQQTIDVPASRKVHFDVVLPMDVPYGKTDVVLDFKPAARQSGTAGSETKSKLDPVLDAAFKEASEKRKAYCADPRQQEETRALRGRFKDSPIWGGLDGVSYQRKIRDEWEERLVRMGLSNNTD
jgi:hypothetical protein